VTGRRPLGVVVIVLFELINTVTALLALTGVIPKFGEGGIAALAERGELWRDLTIAIYLLAIVASVGLWFLSRRAWVLTMMLVGAALLLGLYSWSLGDPNFPRLLLNAIIALYLNQPAVQVAVGHRREPPVERVPLGS
jgi:hypothetical protein